VSGTALGWLALKLLSQKAGLYELTPPALEELVPTLMVLWLVAGLARSILLASLARREADRAVGILSADPDLVERLGAGISGHALIRLGLEALPNRLAELHALVIAVPLETLDRVSLEALAWARGAGLPVMTLPRFVERVSQRTPLTEPLSVGGLAPGAAVDPVLVLDESLTRRSALQQSVKRVLDLVLATVLLVLTLAPLLVLAVLIRLESRGPVLYRQVRAGLNRRPFTLYKLRTMVDGAEPDGPMFASEGDTRVTRIGRFLRKSRMDELPQLLNILKNEMSLVGPRPERPEHELQLAPLIPYYSLRHLVKPGLTGWAQVRVGYSDSPERARVKLEHDLYYLKHASVGFDLAILWATVGVVLRLGGR
jgi:lipopolysaccharide/colanic/teichoic acid biosynthesis glycosyltransferase